jgi:hypothetical protein
LEHTPQTCCMAYYRAWILFRVWGIPNKSPFSALAM